MEGNATRGPIEFVRDGKLTRRTFIKGVGWITVVSALGAGLAGCAPQGREDDASTDGSQDAGQTQGETTYSYACCSYNCTSRCLLKGHVRDGKLVAVEPGEMPGRPDYANACLRSMSYIERVQDESQRVMYPMKRIGERGSGEFERISWDQAMDEIAERMEESKEKYGSTACSFYAFTGNQSKLAMQSATRFAGCYGGAVYDIEGIMGDHGASMGMQMVYGVIRGAHDTRDYEQNSNMIVIWGRNLADTHTSELRYIVRARERGAKIVYIDPRFSSTATIADQWIPIKPGGDSALALGVMNWIIQNDRHDKEFLSKHSCGSLLVRDDDGKYLRGENDAYLVWDPAQNKAVPSDTEGVDAPIEGSFQVDGVACKPAFVHLRERAAEYTLERTSELTGVPIDVIEAFAREYIDAQPAGIRMGQGMQRTFNSYQSFRTVATLAAVAGYVGVRGGGASHAGGTKANKPVPGETAPEFNYDEWVDTGDNKSTMVKSSLVYQCAVDHDPVPIDFMWFSVSNFLNQSPDAHRIINEVFPNISTIVVADPWWTWTAKYADYVLPATSLWEYWDLYDRAPWVFLVKPAIEPLGESKSDCEMMTMLAERVGLGHLWSKTPEEWVRSFPNPESSAFKGFDFDEAVKEGMWGMPTGIYDEPLIVFEDHQYSTPTGRFEFYTEDMVEFGEEVPVHTPALEASNPELAAKYPLMHLTYHDRLNVHTQHFNIASLDAVQAEPMLQINPADAEPRGIQNGDMVRLFNDRGEASMRAFVTEGIMPGVTAAPAGWTPERTASGSHQFLSHLTLSPAEEHYSQTNSAFNDIMIEVEKA
ncbi:MAG TPA: molybdopterin-dependent oxidoreductase [Candidatus Rubneribacter avistercoris]|nr:molybdopterin-dependent oxidoreductase [Candidatus Rubneribacter avistercoris]